MIDKELKTPGFIMKGDSYMIGYNQPRWTVITPTRGAFKVEVWEIEEELVVDYEIGEIYGNAFYYQQYEELYLNSLELTVDKVRERLASYKIELPDDLAEQLSAWQERFRSDEEGKIAETEAGNSEPEF